MKQLVLGNEVTKLLLQTVALPENTEVIQMDCCDGYFNITAEYREVKRKSMQVRIHNDQMCGMGSYRNVFLAKEVFKENYVDIVAVLQNAELIILTGGLGGGMGSVFITELAKACHREQKVIAYVTTPGVWENPGRKKSAEETLGILKELNVKVFCLDLNEWLTEQTSEEKENMDIFGMPCYRKLVSDISKEINQVNGYGGKFMGMLAFCCVFFGLILESHWKSKDGVKLCVKWLIFSYAIWTIATVAECYLMDYTENLIEILIKGYILVGAALIIAFVMVYAFEAIMDFIFLRKEQIEMVAKLVYEMEHITKLKMNKNGSVQVALDEEDYRSLYLRSLYFILKEDALISHYGEAAMVCEELRNELDALSTYIETINGENGEVRFNVYLQKTVDLKRTVNCPKVTFFPRLTRAYCKVLKENKGKQ